MKNIFKVKGKFKLFPLLLFLIVTNGTGYISGCLTSGSKEVYETLQKPFFAPPSKVFMVVWPTLYILMGIAAYRVWMYGKEKGKVKKALVFFFIQLIFNFLWSIIFFILGLRAIAFLELVILIIFIIVTIVRFYKIDKISGILMIPYLLWCFYAAILNFFIWYMNA